MKKTIITLTLFTISISAFSQTFNQDATLNIFNVLVHRWFDASYEYYINEESSAGFSFTARLANDDDLDFNQSYAVAPYYRYYINHVNYNTGLFGEVFIKFNGGEEKFEKEVTTTPEEDPTLEVPKVEIVPYYEKYNNVGFGLSGGYKFRSEKGFVAEGYAGIGRNLLDSGGPNLVYRLNLSLGYAF